MQDDKEGAAPEDKIYNIKNLKEHLQDEYENDLHRTFEELAKDNDFNQDLEKIFDETKNLQEIHSKIIALIKNHLKINKKNLTKGKALGKISEEELERSAARLYHILTQDLDTELDFIIGKVSRKDKDHALNIEAKKHIKRIIKNFAIYQIYKIMNPKRIAGETAKDNYRHNLIKGGEKLAKKYEGGRESDLKKYGTHETQKIQRQAAKARSKGVPNIGR